MLYDLRHQMTLASLPCFFHISYLALFPIYHFPQICISTPQETDFFYLEGTAVVSVLTTWVEKWGTETLQSYQNALHLWHWWNSDHRSTARCFHCWLLELLLVLVLLATCYYQTQTWNLSKNLHDPIFRWKNFTHWKRVNWDYFRQQ